MVGDIANQAGLGTTGLPLWHLKLKCDFHPASANRQPALSPAPAGRWSHRCGTDLSIPVKGQQSSHAPQPSGFLDGICHQRSSEEAQRGGTSTQDDRVLNIRDGKEFQCTSDTEAQRSI